MEMKRLFFCQGVPKSSGSERSAMVSRYVKWPVRTSLYLDPPAANFAPSEYILRATELY